MLIPRMVTKQQPHFAVLLLTLFLMSCANEPATSDAPSDMNEPQVSRESPSDPVTESPSAVPVDYLPPAPIPDHNYKDRQDSTYFYVSLVSEENRQRGIAVGDVYAFDYLGRNDVGEHVLASINDNGSVNYRARCPSNCKIIQTSYGARIAYSPTSIIGAAFEDAIRGKLKVAKWAKIEAEVARRKAAAENDPIEDTSTETADPNQIVVTRDIDQN